MCSRKALNLFYKTGIDLLRGPGGYAEPPPPSVNLSLFKSFLEGMNLALARCGQEE